MMMSFFCIYLRSIYRGCYLFSLLFRRHFVPRFFFRCLSDCCYVSFPVHYNQITVFLFIWCEGVTQMQIGEHPKAPARLNLSPSSCQSQIIASTTKRHGQFRNRFREIGESNGRRQARFCAVKSMHEHMRKGKRKRAFACAEQPWNQGIWKLQGFLEI